MTTKTGKMGATSPRAPRKSAGTVKWARRLEVGREVLRNPLTVIGLSIIFLFLLMAIFAPLLAEPNQPDPYQSPRDWSNIDSPPGIAGHVLGTDSTGGDVLYGIIWGSRLSLQLSVTVVLFTLVFGTIVGSIAAMKGGRIDNLLMRIVDVFLSIPELIFALAIAAVLGPAFSNIILALAAVFWVKYARAYRIFAVYFERKTRGWEETKFILFVDDHVGVIAYESHCVSEINGSPNTFKLIEQFLQRLTTVILEFNLPVACTVKKFEHVLVLRNRCIDHVGRIRFGNLHFKRFHFWAFCHNICK